VWAHHGLPNLVHGPGPSGAGAHHGLPNLVHGPGPSGAWAHPCPKSFLGRGPHRERLLLHARRGLSARPVCPWAP